MRQEWPCVSFCFLLINRVQWPQEQHEACSIAIPHLVHTSAACLVSVFALLLLLLESIPCSVRGRTCTFNRTIKLSIHNSCQTQDEKRRKNRGFLSLIIDLCSRNLGLFFCSSSRQTACILICVTFYFLIFFPSSWCPFTKLWKPAKVCLHGDELKRFERAL